MRTTVTLDADVEALLKKAMREQDAPFKQVLNAAIREGLTATRRKTPSPFRQPTFDMGKPLVDLSKALSLAAELEDAETVAKTQSRRARR